jgi:hypothetical protein
VCPNVESAQTEDLDTNLGGIASGEDFGIALDEREREREREVVVVGG